MSATGDATDAGTTLVEALVVVTITAMTGLIGFPKLQQAILTFSQRQTVAVVAAKLREAKADALRQDRPVVFAITPDGGSYGALDGVSVHAPPGVSLATPSGQGGRIAFESDGSTDGGVVWVRAARRVVTVSVAAPGGAVAVAPG
jgi:type II secretory pathway pseudopilin PulG